jgi:hypothetical protein
MCKSGVGLCLLVICTVRSGAVFIGYMHRHVPLVSYRHRLTISLITVNSSLDTVR